MENAHLRQIKTIAELKDVIDLLTSENPKWWVYEIELTDEYTNHDDSDGPVQSRSIRLRIESPVPDRIKTE